MTHSQNQEANLAHVPNPRGRYQPANGTVTHADGRTMRYLTASQRDYILSGFDRAWASVPGHYRLRSTESN
jgi:hypothetical protein